MRITELVRTYRLLSDPEAPAWNVKFVSALAVFGLVAVGAGSLYMVTRVDDAAAPGAYADTAGAAQEVRSVYVGVPPQTPVTDASAADAALARWKAEHPGATLVSQEPVASSLGGVAGYSLRYRE
jgi:hypothetical protein